MQCPWRAAHSHPFHHAKGGTLSGCLEYGNPKANHQSGVLLGPARAGRQCRSNRRHESILDSGRISIAWSGADNVANPFDDLAGREMRRETHES